MADNPNNHIFSKSRIANVSAGASVFWFFSILSILLLNGKQETESNLAVLGIFAFVAGMAAKHLWDSCRGDG